MFTGEEGYESIQAEDRTQEDASENTEISNDDDPPPIGSQDYPNLNILNELDVSPIAGEGLELENENPPQENSQDLDLPHQNQNYHSENAQSLVTPERPAHYSQENSSQIDSIGRLGAQCLMTPERLPHFPLENSSQIDSLRRLGYQMNNLAFVSPNPAPLWRKGQDNFFPNLTTIIEEDPDMPTYRVGGNAINNNMGNGFEGGVMNKNGDQNFIANDSNPGNYVFQQNSEMIVLENDRDPNAYVNFGGMTKPCNEISCEKETPRADLLSNSTFKGFPQPCQQIHQQSQPQPQCQQALQFQAQPSQQIHQQS
jgi:hypothetical protein